MAVQTIKIKRGTRAQLDAAAVAGTLLQGEPYLVTDEGRIAVGTSATTYKIAANMQDVGGSIDAEVAAREAGDAALQAALDSLSASLVIETARAQAAETGLQSSLDSEVSRAQAAEGVLQSNIDAEAAARVAADDALSARIDSVLSNTDPAALDSLTEVVTAFQAADSNLNGAITSLADSAAAGLTAETSARTAADVALQSSIDAEVAARESAIANLVVDGGTF